MTAPVVSLAAARRARASAPRDRLSAQAEVRGRSVVILARERDGYFTPAAVRSLARGLLTLADAAETGLPPRDVSEGEAHARLVMLGEALDRFESGEARMLELMGMLRQLTNEVRRG